MQTPHRSNAQTDGYCLYEMSSDIVTNLMRTQRFCLIGHGVHVLDRPDPSEVDKLLLRLMPLYYLQLGCPF